jgi:hypothetical protein
MDCDWYLTKDLNWTDCPVHIRLSLATPWGTVTVEDMNDEKN